MDRIIDRDDNVINLCEMKFSMAPFRIDKRYAAELANKVGAFTSATRTRKSVFITFINKHGLTANAYSRQLVERGGHGCVVRWVIWKVASMTAQKRRSSKISSLPLLVRP